MAQTNTSISLATPMRRFAAGLINRCIEALIVGTMRHQASVKSEYQQTIIGWENFARYANFDWLLVYFLVQGVMLGWSGQSIGKKCLGIQVVKADFTRAGWIHALWLREVFWVSALLGMQQLVSLLFSMLLMNTSVDTSGPSLMGAALLWAFIQQILVWGCLLWWMLSVFASSGQSLQDMVAQTRVIKL